MNKFLLIFLVFVLVGCGTHCPNNHDLIGSYCYNRKSNSIANDSIFLFHDGTYKYVNYNFTEKYTTSNLWVVDSLNCVIKFANFSFGNDLGSGTWISKIKNEDKKIKLMYSEEDNLYFLKEE